MRRRTGSPWVACAFVIALSAGARGDGTFSGAADPSGVEGRRTDLVPKGTTVDGVLGGRDLGHEEADFDPGVPPEGDYLGWAAYTRDGGRLLVTNRLTDNVTVFDGETGAFVANIDVGTFPGGIATSDDYAVVACAFSDDVYVIDLSDGFVAAVVPTGEQPWVVRISPDQRYAYVACDIDDVCEVIDLQTLSHVGTVTEFPVALLTFSFGSENGRNAYTFTDFEVTSDGGHLVVGDWDDSVLFFDASTGSVAHAVTGVPNCATVELSGDGSTVVAVSTSNPAQVHQIDVASHALATSVTIPGHTISITYDAGVNGDGSKAFVALSGNASGIVRFPTSDTTIIPSTYTPFWIGTSPDHALAIGGQFRFSVVDFATETVLGQHQGNTQDRGAVSPVGSRVAGMDPLRHEGVYFYDYAIPSAPSYLGTTVSGADPEVDAPRRVALTSDGSRAVVANVLSGNVVILDVDHLIVETTLPIGDRVQDVAITSDDAWAVVCGFETGSVFIIDLATNSVAAEVPAGARAGVVTLTPDDAYAYVGNISANTVSVIALDGASSHEVAEFPCGVIGVSWVGYGVLSDVKASPSGEAVLVAASFDDAVKVVDTDTQGIVASLDVGDFPLQIAFDGDGDYAVVTNLLADSYSILHVDGAASSVVGTFPTGDGPLRLAYNLVLGRVGIGNHQAGTLVHIDPETGDVMGVEGYGGFGGILQVEFDAVDGRPIVLTGSDGVAPGHIHRAGEAIALPAVPAFFDYAGPGAIIPDGGLSEGGVALVVMPGPDYVTRVRWDPSGAPSVATVPLAERPVLLAPRPNPPRGSTRLRFVLPRDGEVELFVTDVSGRRVAMLAEGSFAEGEHSVTWETAGLARGVYHALLRVGGRNAGARKIVAGGF